MTETISFRLGKDLEKELVKVEKKWMVDRSEIIRRLLAKALREWKIQNALEELATHTISLGAAAEECGVSIWEMMELAKQRKIDWIGYTEEDLKRDLTIINDI
ncbi:MAG: UPF0175 family protein [Nanoarchaeota archaeon]